MMILRVAAAALFAFASVQGFSGRQLLNDQQPNAEFIAVWSDTPVAAIACSDPDESPLGSDICADFPGESDSASTDLQLIHLGKIKVAQHKDVVVTVSAVVELFTFTEATGKRASNGDITFGTSSAGAEVKLEVLLVGQRDSDTFDPSAAFSAKPGQITFAARNQAIAVGIDGDIIGDGGILSLELESVVSVALGSEAAHTFTFLAPDLDQDTYDVIAVFDLGAQATANADSYAAGRVVVGKRVMTVQEVRSCKGCIAQV